MIIKQSLGVSPVSILRKGFFFLFSRLIYLHKWDAALDKCSLRKLPEFFLLPNSLDTLTPEMGTSWHLFRDATICFFKFIYNPVQDSTLSCYFLIVQGLIMPDPV